MVCIAGSVELVLFRHDSHSGLPTHPIEEGHLSENSSAESNRPTVIEKEASSDTMKPVNETKSSCPTTPTKLSSGPAISTPVTSPAERPEVLVVDDDPLTITLMKRMLTRMGCDVSTAENGQLAVEMLTGSTSLRGSNNASDGPLQQGSSKPARVFSIVFMDNQMPVMSGLKAVKKLRELGRMDFVVGVTGKV